MRRAANRWTCSSFGECYTSNTNKSPYRRFSEADVRLNNTIEMRGWKRISPCMKRFENDTPMIGSPVIECAWSTRSPKFFNLLRNKNRANTNEDTSRVYYTIYLCKQKNSYPFQLSYFSRDFQILSNTSRLSLNFQSLNSKHFQYYIPKYIRSPTNPIRKDRANKTNRVVSSCFCVHDRKKKKRKKNTHIFTIPSSTNTKSPSIQPILKPRRKSRILAWKNAKERWNDDGEGW